MQVRTGAPTAWLIRFAVIAVLCVLLVSVSACAPVFGSWSGDWRSADGSLLILTPDQSLATVAFNSDDSMVGHFVASSARHATVDWIVFPTPASAALGWQSTLTRSWNQLALTSRSEAATYSVCVFPPEDATPAAIGDLEYRLRIDPAVVDVTYLSAEDILNRFKNDIQHSPQMLQGIPIGDDIRPCVLLSVRSTQDPAAFVHRVEGIPLLAAHPHALDPAARGLVVAGPRGERTIWFKRENE